MMAETETGLPSNMVFIDVASEAQQYSIPEVDKPAYETLETPSAEVSKPIKEETNSPETSLTGYLPIQKRRIRCPECQRYTAENEEKMLRHIRKVHRGENPFQCSMCDYSTYNKVLFEEHVRIHQGIKPYKCAHCPYRSASKKNTKKHEKRHSDDNPFKCKQCGFLARHAKGLNNHLTTHRVADVTKQCSMCKETLELNAYTNHRKNRKRCPECQELFCSSVLREHRSEVHGIRSKRKSPIAKKAIFTCAICKWMGNSKPRILLHLIHHPNQAVDDEVVDTLVLRQLGIMGEGGDALQV